MATRALCMGLLLQIVTSWWLTSSAVAPNGLVSGFLLLAVIHGSYGSGPFKSSVCKTCLRCRVCNPGAVLYSSWPIRPHGFIPPCCRLGRVMPPTPTPTPLPCGFLLRFRRRLPPRRDLASPADSGGGVLCVAVAVRSLVRNSISWPGPVSAALAVRRPPCASAGASPSDLRPSSAAAALSDRWASCASDRLLRRRPRPVAVSGRVSRTPPRRAVPRLLRWLTGQ